jgi:uncharacterized sporulation protein YeaH/YhbH (DUF444 family)
MTTIVDRRTEKGQEKFYTSRKRFLNKNRKQIKKAITRKIANSDLDTLDKGGVDVTVPHDGVSEPIIHHGQGGRSKEVRPGNKQFSTGDRHEKPQGGGGGGAGEGEPGDSGDGEDAFTFHLSEDETLDIIFEDLELPNLSKQKEDDSKQTRPAFKAFVKEGIYRNLNRYRSTKQRKLRHSVANKKGQKRVLELMNEQRLTLSAYDPEFDADNDTYGKRVEKKPLRSDKIQLLENEISRLLETFGEVISEEDTAKFEAIDKEILAIEEKKKLVPKWNETMDMVYKKNEDVPVPIAKAAMFCLMDVSGSMTEERKANAKMFYWLLKKFLERNYEEVDIIFIRHTHEAEEVDEQTFFYDRKSGGTQVSTSIEKMMEVMSQRYPVDQWNIYGAQASDGENFGHDNQRCVDLLQKVMPDLQAYFYTQIAERDNSWQVLWDLYQPLMEQHAGKFFMGKIKERRDIVPIFRDFFETEDAGVAMLKGPQASFFENMGKRSDFQKMEVNNSNPKIVMP